MLSRDPSEPRPEEPPRGTRITLREAVSTDAEFVLTLARQSFLEYGSYDDYLKDWFAHPDVTTVIAEIDGVWAGFFMLTHYIDGEASGERVADLVAIAVAPEHQSRGVGRRLLERAIAAAREKQPSVHRIRLVVAEGNARAQRFFSRQGFRSGRGIGVYPAGQRALRMEKSLRETA